MIILLHGENTKESRNYYFTLKNSAKNPLPFEGATVTITDLVQAIEGQGLFADQSEIFIEDLFSKRKQSKEFENILQYFNQHHEGHNIILWESKELSPKQHKSLNNIEIKKFDFPKTLFAFLDALKPNNTRTMIQLFHKTLETEEPEFIFFMIVRQFRILLAFSDIQPQTSNLKIHNPSSNFPPQIDEVKRLAPWQKGKLQKQMQLFGKEKLLEIYKELFKIEESMKTGKLASSLTQAIDFFLASI